MTEHSINRDGPTDSSTDEQVSETEDTDNQEDMRSEVEIKRELRQSAVGRAILDIGERRRGRR